MLSSAYFLSVNFRFSGFFVSEHQGKKPYYYHVDDVLVEYLLLFIFILKINFPDVCQVCVGASANTMNQNITLRGVLIIDEFLIFYFFEFFLKE